MLSEAGDSVENQIEICKEYINNKLGNGHTITVYEDEGFSAKNFARPMFTAMLTHIRQHLYDCVVCYRLDRISRNVSDFTNLIEELNRLDVAFICVREEFDTNKPMGKAMMYIASVFAQLERETIAERVRDNMLLLAESGRWLGGSTPFGYAAKRMTLANGKSCCILTEDVPLLFLQEAFMIFAKTGRITEVNGYLKSQGYSFTTTGIKGMLANPVYCAADIDAYRYFKQQEAKLCFTIEECNPAVGLMVYNKRSTSKQHPYFIVAKGKHPPAVDGKLFAKVQQLLAKRQPKATSNKALLAGILCCGCCGAPMYAKVRGDGNYDYICATKLKQGKKGCSNNNLSKMAEQTVWNAFVTFIMQEEQLQKQINKEIQYQKDQLHNKLTSLLQSVDKIPKEHAMYPLLQAQIIEVQAKLQLLLTPPEPHALFRQLLCLPVEQKRWLLLLAIDKITWKDGEIKIIIEEKRR